ncbi:MAG: metallophosphoesterase [Pseudomonadota bacterium]
MRKPPKSKASWQESGLTAYLPLRFGANRASAISIMPTRLFHISDLHFGAQDNAALDKVANAIASETPDLVVCTGDLTQRAKRSEFEAAENWFASIEVPVVMEPGNHDMPYYNMFERLFDPFRRFKRLHRATAEQSFENDDCIILPLRTAVPFQPRFPWVDGLVTRSALAATVKRLEDLKNDPRLKLVTGHHPLLGPETKPGNPTIAGESAFAALAGAGAHAMLTGHVHVPFDRLRQVGRRSMRMIGAGTLSTRLRHGAPPSYQVITCDGPSIVSELRTLPNPET